MPPKKIICEKKVTLSHILRLCIEKIFKKSKVLKPPEKVDIRWFLLVVLGHNDFQNLVFNYLYFLCSKICVAFEKTFLMKSNS